MALERDGVVYTALSRVTAAAASRAHQIGGATKLAWQFWGSDGAATQVDLGAIESELQGRIVVKDNIIGGGETVHTGPWVRIGTLQTAVGGALVRDVTPIEVSEVRLNVISLTLAPATDLIGLIRIS